MMYKARYPLLLEKKQGFLKSLFESISIPFRRIYFRTH